MATPAVHCPACRVAAELSGHRDATASGWSIRRTTLNFAILIARRSCPDYEPTIDRPTGTPGEGSEA